MAKKIRYFYDDETCSFKAEKVTFKSAVKTVFSYLTVSGLLACLIVAVLFFGWDDPKTSMLKNENDNLSAKVKEYKKKFSALESQVDALHDRDNTFYRSVMSSTPISEGEWNGGKGGSANGELFSHPETVRETEIRLDILNAKIATQSESYDMLFDRLLEKRKELAHVPAIKPVSGRVISGFGMRVHPIHNFRKMHTGLDMEAATNTPVYATGDGSVKFAGVSRYGYGIHIDIDHGFGYETKYAHLSKLAVENGQKVKRGDIIGYSGNTGLSKGPHLHYEIIKDGEKIDPVDYFYEEDLSPEEFVQLRKEAQVENESMD
jgi:murein DD-endopeptidase MepM/ murein hydrolase activator NlpD